ncbi:MAG TPA: hypothetical protein VGA61_12620, partial [Anaerolineae bacterium]
RLRCAAAVATSASAAATVPAGLAYGRGVPRKRPRPGALRRKGAPPLGAPASSPAPSAMRCRGRYIGVGRGHGAGWTGLRPRRSQGVSTWERRRQRAT